MVAARTTTTTTSTRGRRPHKARTFLTYSVPGGASRAAESISLRALRVATPRTVNAGTPQDLVNPWTLAFGPAGDALYVATDPNHRTVHRFDAAGKLVRAERCADEAPNYLLCV